MNESQAVTAVDELPFWNRHNFLLLIILTILISSVLVLISMNIYYSSGAAQLDLSRPGYKGVRSQAVTSDSDFQNYSSTGPINQSAITEFKLLYDQQAKKTKAVDAFGGDPLSLDALGISAKSE